MDAPLRLLDSGKQENGVPNVLRILMSLRILNNLANRGRGKGGQKAGVWEGGEWLRCCFYIIRGSL